MIIMLSGDSAELIHLTEVTNLRHYHRMPQQVDS
jgi:hypothetical protein